MRYQIYEAKSVKYDAQQRVGVIFSASCKNQNPEALAIQGFPGSLSCFAGLALRNICGLITYLASALAPSISIEPGRKNAANATMIMPIPQMMNHFSTPNFSAKGPEIMRPNGIARDAALVNSEKTLPRYSGLTFS